MKIKLFFFFVSLSITCVSQWQKVDISSFSKDAGSFLGSLDIDKNSNIYAAYRHNSFKLDVIKYNGSSWAYLGTPEITSNEVKAAVDIKTNHNNVPYVVYSSNNAANQKLTVIKFDENKWEVVGNADFTPGVANSPKISFDSNNIPYVVFDDFVDNMNKTSVMKFNGNSWELVGMRGFSGSSAYTTISIDNNNAPYVAFNSTANGNAGKASVMKFNGTNWVFVGAEGFSTGYSRNHSLAFDNNNILHLAYHSSGTNGGSSNVLKYNGTTWENIGNPGMGFYAKEQNLFIDNNNNLYLSYTETTTNTIRVHRYNGVSWSLLGNSSIGVGNYSAIVKNDNNDVFVAYSGVNTLDVSKINDNVLSVEEQVFDDKIQFIIYPNPSTSNVIVSSTKKFQKIELFNLLGKKLLQINPQKPSLDVSSLSKGMYIIKVKIDDISISKKLLVN